MAANALLASLDLDGIDIGPSSGRYYYFLSGRFDYAVRVPSTTTATTVVAAPALAGATAVIAPTDADPATAGHQIDLAEGDNTITVTVSNGTLTNTYTVVITRLGTATLTDNTALSALSLSGIDIGDFNPATAAYTARISNSTAAATVTATPADQYAKVINITPADADPATAGHQISLAEGDNTITVVVDSAAGTTQQTYTVAVDRAYTPFRRHSARDLSGIHLNGIWSDGTTMWAANSFANVKAYDLATGARRAGRDINTNTLSAAGNEHPTGLWSDGATMWVADNGDDKVYAYDLATRTRKAGRDINTLSAAGNRTPTGLWSDGTTMWVVDQSWYAPKIYAYDLATGARRAGRDVNLNTLSAAGNESPDDMWSDGTTMWVIDQDDNKIYAYDLATGARKPDLDFDTLAAAGQQQR